MKNDVETLALNDFDRDFLRQLGIEIPDDAWRNKLRQLPINRVLVDVESVRNHLSANATNQDYSD